jgi:hypothetical protein
MKMSMKVNKIRLMFSILLIIVVALYTVGLLSLDYTFTGAGFSPFKTWSPAQTAYFAIFGLVFLSILILYNSRNRNVDLRGLVHIPPIIGLSFLILFSMDSRQVLQYLPYLQILLFDDFGSLFLFGGILGLYLTYLVSVNPNKTLSDRNNVFEFGVRSILVVLSGPILLGPVFYLALSLCLSLGLGIFPFFGEGTIGSVLVASVLLSMYTSARALSHFADNGLPSLQLIKLSQVLKFIVESIAVYLCTAAGFSLVGGLVTDGVPTTELIPFSIVLLGFFAVLPFSILLTRFRVFSIKEEIAPPV